MLIKNTIQELFEGNSLIEIKTNGCSASKFYKSKDVFLKVMDTSWKIQFRLPPFARVN